MNSDDPKLTAYALGELSGPERETFEKRLRDDPALRAAVDETAAFASLLGEAFHAEPPLAALAPAQRAEVLEEARHGRKTLPFPRPPWVAWTLRLAAALAVLAAFGRFVLLPAARPPHVATVPSSPQKQLENREEPLAAAQASPLPAAPLLAEGNIASKRGAEVIGGQAPADGSRDFAASSASSGNFLNLANSQAAPAGRLALQNTDNATPLDLTAQKPREAAMPADASSVKAAQPVARNETPAATAGARHSMETKVQSQIGFAGQTFGNGTPIDERAAKALITAAPAATTAPTLESQPLLAQPDALEKTGKDAAAEFGNKSRIAVSAGSAASAANRDAKKQQAPAPGGADLLRKPAFSSKELAAAVNHYVALGEAAAVRELTEIADNAPGDRQLRERIGLVCRVLYIPRGTQTLRPLRFIGGTPLGGVNTYTGTAMLQPSSKGREENGRAAQAKREVSQNATAAPEESVADYLSYCRANGVFRTLPIVMPKGSPK